MSGKILRYFAGGNTATGYHNLYDSNLRGLDRVFILSGKSSTEKASMIEKLLDAWKEKGFPLEAIHSPNDPDALEGMIIREIGFGIVDGDSPRMVGKEYVGDRWETVDLDLMGYSPRNSGKEREILKLTADREAAFTKAYASYESALKVHDQWEKLYIDQMDFAKADRVAEQLIERLFPSNSTKGSPSVRRRFLGAATPVGPVDFVANITAGLNQRYFLKGRAGTGKSTILKKLVSEAEKRDFELEVYHCGFDPGSLDMVLVRELGWAVFDSTQPHEYFPSRGGDEVIDMYELTVAPGTDEMFAKEIAEIEKKYRENMKHGRMYLAEAKRLNDELEAIYRKSTNQNRMDEIFSDLDKEIKHLAKA